MCGEHASIRAQHVVHLGSSPRVRGTPRLLPVHEPVLGIIPACAGNTPFAPASARWGRDHPRVCGEHPSIVGQTGGDGGSSPRVRGTRTLGQLEKGAGGIIPACAGNTLNNPSSKSRKRKNKLHFNQFAEEMQRCLTVRFCAMGSFVVKVQQAKHGFQTVVWRLW